MTTRNRPGLNERRRDRDELARLVEAQEQHLERVQAAMARQRRTDTKPPTN